jgi:hypothetical protein
MNNNNGCSAARPQTRRRCTQCHAIAQRTGRQCRLRTCATARFCWIHTRAGRPPNHGLRVKPSTIPNAGLGLFAAVDIPADTVIAYYRGQRLTRKQLDRRYGRHHQGDYVIKIRPNVYIDACNTQSTVARYANTCDVPVRVRAPCRNNAIFLYDEARNRLELLSCDRPIRRGEEITVSYGDGYVVLDHAPNRGRPCTSRYA